MCVIDYPDTVIVPSSLFLMVGYHAYLWHCFKNKPSQTTEGVEALKRKTWFLQLKEGDDKNGMLAVQSLRNAQMATILTASIAILINLALVALTNNAYHASHFLNNTTVFGSTSGKIYALKFGLASLFLLVSFLCSSMGLAFLIDANFLINAARHELSSSPTYTQTVFERGFLLALVGNRVLCITFPLVIWMFGPVPVALSSMALVWVLYEMDFSGKKLYM